MYQNMESGDSMKVLVSGGGTAGHINPALAIAKYMRDNHGAELLFVGTKKGMESRLVPKENIPMRFVNVEGLARKLTLQNLKTLYKFLKSIGDSKKIIQTFSPDIVIGTGGYVCAPVLMAAHRLGIPTIIHEQNVIPGVTVKLAAKSVDKVAISFAGTIDYLPQKLRAKCILTGNPLRESMLKTSYEKARRSLKLNEKPFIVMFGGSLGAEKLNETMVEFLNASDTSEFSFLAGTGEKHYEQIMAKLNKNKLSDSIKIQPYIHNMDTVLPAADLVISRAGALTISELAALGKPSILIPSPYVAHNHQEFNARAMEKGGASTVITEAELNAATLKEAVDSLIHNRIKRTKMAQSAQKMGICDATKKICDIALELIHKQ